MKKTLTFLTALLLLASILAVGASAQETEVNFFCDYCTTADNNLGWQPLTAASFASTGTLSAGHYYLTEDIPNCKQKIISGTVCLNLNGCTISSNGRAFLSNAEGKILNIMDTKGGGKIVSTDGTNNPSGGTVTASNGGNAANGAGTVNLYSGTIAHVTGSNTVVTKGGVVYINGGIFNMYGGCVDASQCSLKAGNGTTDTGAAIAVGENSTLHISGGEVISGTAASAGTQAECVFVQSTTSAVTLSGNAQVDELYFYNNPADCFSIDGAFTGEVKLAYGSKITVEAGMDTGNLINSGSITGADVTCDIENCYVVASGTNLVLSMQDPNAQAAVIDGDTITNYNSWEDAFSNAGGKLVRLYKPIETAVSISEDLHLDLNGKSITGVVTVASGKTLYCMDSQTDDFTVADDNYGRLTSVEGTVKGIPVESTLAQNGYLMITEGGETSFHCVDLRLNAMNLRPGSAGVYYVSNFGGDEMVKDKVQMYGVAMSVAGAPTAENMEADCKCSKFYDFEAGNGNENTSTLLNNVLKETNANLVNRRNANMPVYGRAYMLLEGGTYLFGETAVRSFKEQVEDSSDIWDDLNVTQKDGAYAMYLQYRDFMKKWDLTNYFAYKDPSKDNVLKILNISNSHGQDAVWLIPSVLKAEQPDLEFVVAELYMSYELVKHIEAAKNDSPDYWYQLNSGDGWTTTKDISIKYALQDQSWDIVMFNESSRHLGQESIMEQGRVDWFAEYILDNLDYEPALLYNMTWANPTDENFYTDASRQPAPDTFKNSYTLQYGFSRVNHYNKLVEMTQKYILDLPYFDEIIFDATPIEYAYQVMGVPEYDENQVYDLYRDYTHISDFGRLIVAYNWYCQWFDIAELTEVNVDTIRWEDRAPWGNRHIKLGDLPLTAQHKNVIMESVNYSLENPLTFPEPTAGE